MWKVLSDTESDALYDNDHKQNKIKVDDCITSIHVCVERKLFLNSNSKIYSAKIIINFYFKIRLFVQFSPTNDENFLL